MKILPHHIYRRSELWRQNWGGGNQQAIGKNGLRTHHLHSVFQKFSRGDPDPPPPFYERIKNSPFGFIWSSKLRWKYSHITYIEDRSFEGKIGGGESTGNRQKWAKNAPFALRFSKIFSGKPRPPPFYERIKNPPLALYDPLQLRWKFARDAYIEDRSIEGKNYIQFWGKK